MKFSVWHVLSSFFAATTSEQPVELAQWAVGHGSGKSLPESTYEITFCQPRKTIERYSKESFSALLTTLDHSTGWFKEAGYWVSQNGWTTFASWDAIHGTRDYYNVFAKAQDKLSTSAGPGNALWGVPLMNFYNDDAVWAALANVQAYEAYGDDIFLNRADGVWQFEVDHGYVHQEDLDRGYLKGTKYPSTKLQATCNGQSNLGAVYWQNGTPNLTTDDPFAMQAATQPNINAVSTGLHALLGAELCRLTKNMTYCDYAYSSMQWIDRVLLSPNDLIDDNVSGSTCKRVPHQFTYNAGLYIAAYAELGHITGNKTATELAEKTAWASMTNANWNTPSGVMKEGEGNPKETNDVVEFKAILTRYLLKAYPWLQDKRLKAAIVRFVNVQYWGMVNLDSDSAEHPITYGRNWTGPSYSTWTSHSQILALDVLTALSLNDKKAFPRRGKSSGVVSNGKCLNSA